jgi:hypothetical protein
MEKKGACENFQCESKEGKSCSGEDRILTESTARLSNRFDVANTGNAFNVCRLLRETDIYNPLEMEDLSTTAPLSTDSNQMNVADQLNAAKNQLSQRLR